VGGSRREGVRPSGRSLTKVFKKKTGKAKRVGGRRGKEHVTPHLKPPSFQKKLQGSIKERNGLVVNRCGWGKDIILD